MTFELGSTMKVIRPYPNVLAFYDGRIPGTRAYSPEENWLDDAAFALGYCAYAVIHGREALVYDTHISIPHARLMRKTLGGMGADQIRVVLSHWHPDHIAGNAVFEDCEIIANSLTAKAMITNRERLEKWSKWSPPINPVIMPNTIFDEQLNISVGEITVELRHLDIHSLDETVALLPDGVLLAGDTLEDTVTSVGEPHRLETHLKDLERMATWPIKRIFPSHGSFEVISSGGYDRRFIEATRLYVEKLLRLKTHPELAALKLRDFARDALATGGVHYFDPYEAIHARNIQKLLHAWNI